MKLFLASSIDKTIGLFKPLASGVGNKVLFVTNAADMHQNPWWVDLDRKAFIDQGYNLTELDLREVSADELKKFLLSHDILHVCGGSVYYLLGLILEKGLDSVIKQAIKDETIIYTGTSAGSIIVSQNIKPLSYDPEEANYLAKVPDHKGLGIINFAIMPHCNNANFVEEFKTTVGHIPQDLEPLFFIMDNQAIWIDNDCMKFLSV